MSDEKKDIFKVEFFRKDDPNTLTSHFTVRLYVEARAEASLDLRDVATYTSDEDLRRYLSALLMKHVSDWYWGARDGR